MCTSAFLVSLVYVCFCQHMVILQQLNRAFANEDNKIVPDMFIQLTFHLQ